MRTSAQPTLRAGNYKFSAVVVWGALCEWDRTDGLLGFFRCLVQREGGIETVRDCEFGVLLRACVLQRWRSVSVFWGRAAAVLRTTVSQHSKFSAGVTGGEIAGRC